MQKSIPLGGNKNQNYRCFTLIEALVVLFIFALITMTFYQVITLGTRYIIQAKNRLAATALANEKMEIVRNLKYDDIGTKGGGVEGNILQDEDVTENGRSFHVETSVEYVDDPFDGIGYQDTIWFEDYKRVTTTVSWSLNSPDGGSVQLISRFVPPGVEIPRQGDGILSVSIFSDQPGGAGIPYSSVHIVNPETGLDVTRPADIFGNVKFMGDNVGDSIQKYQITVSKTDYETVSTLPPYPETSFNPRFTHASVVTGLMNTADIVQNKLSDLTIKTVNYLDEPVGSIGFHLTGGKNIGTEYATEPPYDPVYNFSQDGTTDSQGEKVYSAISPGLFTFTLSPAVTNWELINLDPDSPFSLFSSGPLTVKVRLADKGATSLLVKVLKDSDGFPIAGAQVELKNDSFGYNATQNSAANGATFFPATADLFQAGTYDLTVIAGGYADFNSQITINANDLKIDEIRLSP